MQKRSNFPDSQNQAYQLSKLKSVLKIAQEVPFYKPCLQNFNIDHFTYTDFAELPFLTKDKIREGKDTLLNQRYKKTDSVYENTSGGSTGEPLRFMRTKEQSFYAQGSYFYANYLNGINPNDRTLFLWGAVRDMHKESNKSVIRQVKNFLLGTKKLNTFVLNKTIIDSYIKEINAFKPVAIKAYVHSIYDIAKYINANKIEIEGRPIIHTSTGPLYPEMKAEIKRAFNDTHVFSFYGSREVGPMATELPGEEGMMVLYDNIFLEIINKEGKPAKHGEEGEIVVTTLNNHYMPLLRYRIGDRAVKNDHEFSTFGTLRIQSVLGRTLGVIHTKDGNTIDGQFFTTLFFNVRGINNFQLIQKSITQLQLNLIKNEKFDEGELDAILKRIQVEVAGVEIEVEFRTKIDLTSTGKIMYVYSELDLIK